MEKLYKIGELADMCDTTIKTIRYYEKIRMIEPTKIDPDSGYRYFDMDTIAKVQKIQMLKKYGFSLSEIQEFNSLTQQEQINYISKKQRELEKIRNKLYDLISRTVKKVDFTFINDKHAIGKWKCVAVANSETDYNEGKLNSCQPTCEYLYLLKNGVGYAELTGWTKGEIYYSLSKHKWTYEIKNNHMFVSTPIVGQSLLVYEKIDGKERTEPEQDYTDDTTLSFDLDKDAVGLWTIYNHIHKSKIKNYIPAEKSTENYFIKSLSILPNGFCIIDEFETYYKKWTKNFIVDKANKLTMPYKIISHNNKKYLILTWKDDSYRFFNHTTWCYVFEKQ